MISSSLKCAKHLLRINYRFSSKLAGTSNQSFIYKERNVPFNIMKPKQNFQQNKNLKNIEKTICGPIILPLTDNNSTQLRLKSIADEQERYIHLIKVTNNSEFSYRFTFSFKNDAYLFLRSLDILNNECKNGVKSIIESCNLKAKQNPSSSRILFKSSGFVSTKGLYLIGLVWRKNENQLFCEIKFINGANKFSSSDKNNNYNTKTLELHYYQLSTLRNAVYHLVYGWHHTNLLGSKSEYNYNVTKMARNKYFNKT